MVDARGTESRRVTLRESGKMKKKTNWETINLHRQREKKELQNYREYIAHKRLGRSNAITYK